ncbi:MAG TPA: hypothetical protein VME70_10090 [Mycobacteriales bacterium]|nr:hypothetical protein [Mycobacteriales bacterium]
MSVSRLAAGVVLCTTVGMSIAPAAAATTGARPAGAVHTQVYSSCQKPTYRPHSYILTCADAYTQIHNARYSAWGRQRATGHGRYVYNTCEPSCAAGTMKHHPVTFTLYRARAIKGVRLFTRMAVSYAGLTETFTLPTSQD